jgi:hypothetical protein
VKLYRCPEERCPSRHLCGHAVAHERHNCQQMGDCPACRPLRSRTLWQAVSPTGGRCRHGVFVYRDAALAFCAMMAEVHRKPDAYRKARRKGWRVIRTTQVEG